LIDSTPALVLQFDRELMRKLRIAGRMSRECLAGKSGRSFNAIRDLEQGRVQPRADTLGQVAAALGVNADDLLMSKAAALDTQGFDDVVENPVAMARVVALLNRAAT
jgi:transcriptional regulator with XRE-family HTH domain